MEGREEGARALFAENSLPAGLEGAGGEAGAESGADAAGAESGADAAAKGAGAPEHPPEPAFSRVWGGWTPWQPPADWAWAWQRSSEEVRPRPAPSRPDALAPR